MQTKLAALSLIISSVLFASDPCCLPECYTAPHYDLQCDMESIFDIEFLYFYAKESKLSYAKSPNNYKSLNAAWDPGFRIAIGGNFKRDGWDALLRYTFLHNKQSGSAHDSPLINPWINPCFSQTFDQIDAKWKLTLNIFDLEVGRKYYLSPCFTMRPFAGLRSSWYITKFQTTSKQGNEAFEDNFNNKHWGNGIIIGFEPAWSLCSNFILYSQFTSSILWGKLRSQKRRSYLKSSSRLCYFQMSPILELALGLRWEETWCCLRFRTAFDIGWEHHIWFDQGHRMKNVDTNTSFGFRSYIEASSNLSYGGLVIRFRLDF